MTLAYTTSTGKHEIRVPFEPRLSGYEDVKPTLIRMKIAAEEALGMVCRPTQHREPITDQ